MNNTYHEREKTKVIDLRTKGMTFQAIADKTGVNRSTVYVWIKNWAEEHPKKFKRLMSQYRKMKK